MLSLLGAGQGQNISFDADYQAVLNYATSLGYTLPSTGQRVKQNKLLVDLKSAGVWTKLDSFANFATDGSSNFALIDWKNLSLYTAVNSPTFTTNVGFATNGTSSYINTNKITGANFTLNSASEFKWINNPLNASSADATSGARSTDGLGNLYEINDINCFVNSNIVVNFLLNTSAGFRHINRSNNTQVERIVNGVSVVRNQASTSVVNRIPFIGCINTGIASAFESNSFSIYGFGGNLSTEAVNFYNAINTYRNSL